MTGKVWSCHSHVSALPDDLRYDDALGRRYDYDSNVINHNRISAGDLVIIRDRHLIYGYGVIERIDSRPGVKAMSRCPQCRSADVVPRKRLLPRFRCNDCGHAFDKPVIEDKAVTQYSASYENRWFEFPSPVPLRALDGVYAGRDRQNAIRELEPVAAHALLRSHTDVEGYLQLEIVADRDRIDGGHVEAMVRRRIGQHRFRERLLERYGPTCAITGEQPDAVLDAAHLYSFAERGTHQENGGLLLRADVHRLFDRLLLTVDAKTWRSAVAPPLLERHRHLQELDGRPLVVPAGLRPDVGLVAEHQRAARERWRDIA